MPNENKITSEIHGAHEEEVRQVLSKMKHVSEEQQAATVASVLRLPYIDLNIFPVDPETLRTISKEDAEKYEVVCIKDPGKNVNLALANIQNSGLKGFLEKLQQEEGFKAKIFICSESGLKKTIEKYKHIALVDNLEDMQLTLSGKDLEEFEKNLKDVIDLKKRINEIPTTEVINIVMAGAVKMESSDIHFEPQEDGIRLRYRLDGILQNITVLPSPVYHYILSRVKVLSGMKINIRDIAQDGHFSIEMDGKEIDVRVSVLPGNYGENIVMRLLNQQTVALKFDDLGLKGLAYDKLIEKK